MKFAILDILEKKRDGKELTWEEMQTIVQAAQLGNVHAAQLGAFLMACHLRGLNEGEVENLMRAMMFSGRLMKWPSEWKQKIVSLQSTGSTGNKAKLILAPAMAACGVKFPILSARGYDAIGGILDKLRTIPGFSGIKSVKEIEQLLEDVGCCVVQQPSDIAPAEGVIRDMAAIAGTSDNDAFKEACMIARVAALKLHAIVIDIPYGAGEWVKTKEEAMSMAANLDRLRSILGIKIKVLVTAVDWPVGTMMGQSLEISEAMRCLSMCGPPDLHDLVIKLGGHLLHEAGVADTPEAGQQRVHRVIRDGKAKKMFEKMLKAQGVDKSDLKSLMKARKDPNNMSSVLPVANYFTHLSSGDKCGLYGSLSYVAY
ncbi:hypothetical protein CAPTEDRAFT_138143 [Capitella teleta]|uniref:Thymidine phosphorylase n=1 Tax=Capitella teleta TaxID=283909 RepID=R7UY47_CAPTE|nr:hypothetical protein CAPTEDRAFT_138143 [Capitella teleta]|eukprot:ELU08361.1 hypothetical protein CAPTEDRAFT_138143 [Capitella teleta]